MRLLRLIHRAWYQWWYRNLTVAKVEDVPERPTPGVCYLVEEDGVFWAVAFKCPCGCGESITLNLIGQRPRWSAEIDSSERMTVHPSIWRTGSCKSHFWIRNGRIHWAR
ncbi:MAG: DUF6527 family protein [Candidatus Thiodiazotropha sp.]